MGSGERLRLSTYLRVFEPFPPKVMPRKQPAWHREDLIVYWGCIAVIVLATAFVLIQVHMRVG